MTRFYDELMEQLYVGRNKADSYNAFRSVLEDPNTKRILFDSRQAAVFDDIGEELPGNIQVKMRTPFDQFYLEFTTPVLVSGQEPGRQDYARAMIFSKQSYEAILPIGDGTREIYIDALIVFLTGQVDGRLTFVDRAFKIHLSSGLAFTLVSSVREGADPSELPQDWTDEGYVPATCLIRGMEGRHIGWWERAVDSYTTLFSWMMTYMMAKSIRVTEESVPRQQRRWMDRRNIIPRPWHIVKVGPKFYSGVGGDNEESAGHHRFRYDVIGHLRFGKYKTKDGYSETVEWITPHQRGLANSLYIPKTYRVDRGKIVSPRMREYFGEES